MHVVPRCARAPPPSSPPPPSHVRARARARGIINTYESNGYRKNTTVPYRGTLRTSGYSDYLFFCAMYFAVRLGANGGRRATQDYEKLAVPNFAVVIDHTNGIHRGLWVVDAFVKKNSGRGYKRAPYLMLDRGTNKVRARRVK